MGLHISKTGERNGLMEDFCETVKEDRSYLVSKRMEEMGFVNCFSRRLGGASRGEIEGFNFGFRVGDEPKRVYENYELLSKDMGIDIKKAVCARQTHTDNIRVVTKADRGKGICPVDSDIRDTDGLITDEEGMALIIYTADCVPLIFCDTVKKVIGASHAGWRGTAQNIGGKTVRLMKEKFGCEPSDILAAIGPSIGPCCFEVDSATAENFDEKYRIPKSGGKYHVDLWAANRDMIEAAGVRRDNIFVSEECTLCNSDKYYSYRAHKEHAGRQVAMIVI